MAIDDKSVQQFLGYYSFWIFQYTKRSNKFQEEIDAERIEFSKYLVIKDDLREAFRKLNKRIRHDRTFDLADSGEILGVMKKLESLLLALDSELTIDKFIDAIMGLRSIKDFPFRPLLKKEDKQMSSSEIISTIIEKGEITKDCSIRYPESLMYSSINYKYVWATAKDSTSDTERYLHLDIDTDCDIETVLKEIRSAYYDRKSNRIALNALQEARSKLGLVDGQITPIAESCKFLSEDDKSWIEKNESIKSGLIFFKLKRMIRDRGRGFDLDDTPRAIGLWLWDYITNKYGEEKPPRKAHAEAMRAFKEKFDYVKLCYADTESGTYRNWYHRTAACIEACDVLSFKGDGRKKKTKP